MRKPAFRLALLGVFVATVLSVSPWRAAVDAAVRPPKLDYQRLKLPNGLTVLLHQDKSTPIVHVQLWYHVGSKDEKPGRTGFVVDRVEDAVEAVQRVGSLSRQRCRDVFEERFTATRMARDYVALYEELLEQRVGRAIGAGRL